MRGQGAPVAGGDYKPRAGGRTVVVSTSVDEYFQAEGVSFSRSQLLIVPSSKDTYRLTFPAEDEDDEQGRSQQNGHSAECRPEGSRHRRRA